MIKHTMYAISIGLVIFFLYLMQYTGAFKSVTLAVDSRGPYTMIYKDHAGAYHNIVSVIQEVETWAKTQGLQCRLSYGEYLDDPKKVEEGRLKSKGGCLIDPLIPAEAQLFEKLKSKLPPEFKYETKPEQKALVALFTGAPGIGPLKVYPKANEFAQKGQLKRTGTALEIYEVFDQKAMQTIYIWPLVKE